MSLLFTTLVIFTSIAVTLGIIAIGMMVIFLYFWPLSVIKRFLLAVSMLVASSLTSLLFLVIQSHTPFSKISNILAVITLFFLLTNCLVNPYFREKIYGRSFTKKRWLGIWGLFLISCGGLVILWIRLSKTKPLSLAYSCSLIGWIIAPLLISMIQSTIEGVQFAVDSNNLPQKEYLKKICTMNLIFLPFTLLEMVFFGLYFLHISSIISIFIPLYLILALSTLILRSVYYILNKTRFPIYLNSSGILHSNPNLTEREKEITDLLLNGFSNQDIASNLFISLSTVKTHTQNIFKKLNIKKRHELLGLYSNQENTMH